MKGTDVKVAFLENLMKMADIRGYFVIDKITMKNLQTSIKRSERQIYRLLKFFEREGIIYKITRGRYWLNRELANKYIYAIKNKDKVVINVLASSLSKLFETQKNLERTYKNTEDIKKLLEELLKEIKKD